MGLVEGGCEGDGEMEMRWGAISSGCGGGEGVGVWWGGWLGVGGVVGSSVKGAGRMKKRKIGMIGGLTWRGGRGGGAGREGKRYGVIKRKGRRRVVKERGASGSIEWKGE